MSHKLLEHAALDDHLPSAQHRLRVLYDLLHSAQIDIMHVFIYTCRPRAGSESIGLYEALRWITPK